MFNMLMTVLLARYNQTRSTHGKGRSFFFQHQAECDIRRETVDESGLVVISQPHALSHRSRRLMESAFPL